MAMLLSVRRRACGGLVGWVAVFACRFSRSQGFVLPPSRSTRAHRLALSFATVCKFLYRQPSTVPV